MREFRIPIAFCIATLAATTPLSAKTLVFCSEGSPENFYPAINTTGTSFDANGQIYSRMVEFERGGTRVVPGLAERWDISPDGKTDRKSTRLNSSHQIISYAVFCLKKKNTIQYSSKSTRPLYPLT